MQTKLPHLKELVGCVQFVLARVAKRVSLRKQGLGLSAW